MEFISLVFRPFRMLCIRTWLLFHSWSPIYSFFATLSVVLYGYFFFCTKALITDWARCVSSFLSYKWHCSLRMRSAWTEPVRLHCLQYSTRPRLVTYFLTVLCYFGRQRRCELGTEQDGVLWVDIMRRTLAFIHTYGHSRKLFPINPLNTELNLICYLLVLIGAHHFLHVSRIRVNQR